MEVCEDVVCSHNLWLAFPMMFARKLRENWVPGPRIFAKKFGEPRCETLAYPKRARLGWLLSVICLAVCGPLRDKHYSGIS